MLRVCVCGGQYCALGVLRGTEAWGAVCIPVGFRERSCCLREVRGGYENGQTPRTRSRVQVGRGYGGAYTREGDGSLGQARRGRHTAPAVTIGFGTKCCEEPGDVGPPFRLRHGQLHACGIWIKWCLFKCTENMKKYILFIFFLVFLRMTAFRGWNKKAKCFW